MKKTFVVAAPLLLSALLASAVASQRTPEESAAVRAAAGYRVVANQVYHVADGHEAKLDLYLPRGRQTPAPTLIQIHGGGWDGSGGPRRPTP